MLDCCRECQYYDECEDKNGCCDLCKYYDEEENECLYVEEDEVEDEGEEDKEEGKYEYNKWGEYYEQYDDW